mgnify:CR=1 FL=1
MGYCGPVVDLDKFKEGFQRTISRGPDDSRIVDTGNGLLGFHRLAIMGLTPSGMQPFQLDGSYVVCNGEIYGFEKIKEELSDRYSFASDSDCEILLPLYKEYGTDMFAMLDAEFACILYDGDTGEYIAARDPIGIRPLYYGYDEKGVILFASEAKNLVGLTDKIMPFPPGYYYKNGSFTCYCDITKSEHICRDDLETVCRNIYDLLIEGVKKRLVADAKVGFLLSGGLDSSLVCAIAAKETFVFMFSSEKLYPVYTFWSQFSRILILSTQGSKNNLHCFSINKPVDGKAFLEVNVSNATFLIDRFLFTLPPGSSTKSRSSLLFGVVFFFVNDS